MTVKEDLTKYSDAELTLRVMNDVCLYGYRLHLEALLDVVDEVFVYTDIQLATLKEALEDE